MQHYKKTQTKAIKVQTISENLKEHSHLWTKDSDKKAVYNPIWTILHKFKVKEILDKPETDYANIYLSTRITITKDSTMSNIWQQKQSWIKDILSKSGTEITEIKEEITDSGINGGTTNTGNGSNGKGVCCECLHWLLKIRIVYWCSKIPFRFFCFSNVRTL